MEETKYVLKQKEEKVSRSWLEFDEINKKINRKEEKFEDVVWSYARALNVKETSVKLVEWTKLS